MARHTKMQNDLVVRVLSWAGEALIPVGVDPADITASGGDASIYEELRAEKAARMSGAKAEPVIEDGFEDYDDTGWDRICKAMAR